MLSLHQRVRPGSVYGVCVCGEGGIPIEVPGVRAGSIEEVLRVTLCLGSTYQPRQVMIHDTPRVRDQGKKRHFE